MNHQSLSKAGPGCIISPNVKIEDNVFIGARIILDGEGIEIRAGARLDSGCIIGSNVTVGQSAWVRAGSVVLQSIPANAIVEGNPANVVGYRSALSKDADPVPGLIDIYNFDHLGQHPCVFHLNVGKSSLHKMRQTIDPRGSLTVGEVPGELPFTPKRYFAVYGVPPSQLRGEHAHKECEQFLLCLNGSLRVLLDDGFSRCEVTLDRPDMGVYMPAMVWGTQYKYSSDAVLLVLASMLYEPSDYIRDYDKFIALVKSARHE